jgi:hypothetical protein
MGKAYRDSKEENEEKGLIIVCYFNDHLFVILQL